MSNPLRQRPCHFRTYPGLLAWPLLCDPPRSALDAWSLCACNSLGQRGQALPLMRWARVLPASWPVLAVSRPNLCSSPPDSGARVESAVMLARDLSWAGPRLSPTCVWPGILGDSVGRGLRQLQLLAAMLVSRR